MTILEELDRERQRYAERWARSAEKFSADGHYDWMASFVGDFPKVLEIGCGDGSSTVALLRNSHTVVAVEENPHCIESAAARLRAEGFPVEVDLRETAVSKPDDEAYDLHYVLPSKEPPTRGALIIQGDVQNDPMLWAWLARDPKFDAVVCWLMGAHNFRQLNFGLIVDRRQAYQSGMEYRFRVQNWVYARATDWLRTGGVLHIVDRRPALTEQGRSAVIASHRDQASVSTLEVVEHVDERRYAECDDGVPMEFRLGPGMPQMDGELRLSLISTIARMPSE